MKLDVYNLDNEKIGEVEVSDRVFGAEVKPHLFHEVVRMQLANRRRGTHKTKTRSEVRGGGRKPYRQKGTGRARQGSTRAVQWVGGGHSHAKTPRDYSYQLNKKKKRAALRSALSMLVESGNLKVVDQFGLSEVKTKAAATVLARLDIGKAIVVDGKSAEGDRFENNHELRLSVRNLPSFKYLRPDGVNVYDLLNYGQVVVTQDALKGLEARLDR
jgi:large subunit ribosomal protein L4